MLPFLHKYFISSFLNSTLFAGVYTSIHCVQNILLVEHKYLLIKFCILHIIYFCVIQYCVEPSSIFIYLIPDILYMTYRHLAVLYPFLQRIC